MISGLQSSGDSLVYRCKYKGLLLSPRDESFVKCPWRLRVPSHPEIEHLRLLTASGKESFPKWCNRTAARSRRCSSCTGWWLVIFGRISVSTFEVTSKYSQITYHSKMFQMAASHMDNLLRSGLARGEQRCFRRIQSMLIIMFAVQPNCIFWPQTECWIFCLIIPILYCTPLVFCHYY